MWRWVWGETGWRHIDQSKIKHKIIGYCEQRAVHDRQFIGAQRRPQEDFRILGPCMLGIIEVEGVPSTSPELEELQKMIKAEMENACKPGVFLDVEMGVGKDWLEAH